MISKSYKVSGMTCAACAISLESYQSPLDGVRKVSVNYPNQSVAIEFDSTVISIETLAVKAKEIGYTLLIGNAEKAEKNFNASETK